MSPGGLPEAAVFAGRYRVIRCIAVGGMGAVYEVIHLETERRLALKVMHPHFIQSEEMRARFRQEARVAAKVGSVHIVDVVDAGFDEATGTPFLVMELLHGEELGKRLERVKRFPAAEVVSYLHQTALALDKTHRAHIIHRDLKPANLFLCEREDSPPCIKVLDFGIAKLLADDCSQATTRSVGTPMYMAPEQLDSPAVVTPATDIFALGLIAYTLLVGEPYWMQDLTGCGNVFAFAVAVTQGPQEPASARAARQGVTLPRSFDTWFARATAASPADRFPSASAAVRALANALGLPEPGHDYSASSTIVPPKASSAGRLRRAPLAAIMITATAVLIAAGAIVSYAVPFGTGAAIAPPAPAAIAIQQAAETTAPVDPQSAPGSASIIDPPVSAPPAVAPAVSATSRPEIRPPRKTATKGKDRTIYRRD